jgi:hypothetical protein
MRFVTYHIDFRLTERQLEIDAAIVRSVVEAADAGYNFSRA